jgi:hypothetical protein
MDLQEVVSRVSVLLVKHDKRRRGAILGRRSAKFWVAAPPLHDVVVCAACGLYESLGPLGRGGFRTVNQGLGVW